MLTVLTLVTLQAAAAAVGGALVAVATLAVVLVAVKLRPRGGGEITGADLQPRPRWLP